MSLFAAISESSGAGQLVFAAGLAAAGIFLLLPRPRGRSVAGGIASLLAAAAIGGAWINQSFAAPFADWIGTLLFTLFSTGAVAFGAVLVVQTNPARGAIAFAFVILSTCGLFLLLAAPFLMAATIIIYAGAIIVTFLFVLMLSAANGRTDENERSREPLLGTLAGFAFTGLILFALHESQATAAASAPADSSRWNRMVPLPTPTITLEERNALALAAEEIKKLEETSFYPPTDRSRQERTAIITHIEELLDVVLGYLSAKSENTTQFGSIHARLARYRTDRQADLVLKQAEAIRIESTRTLAKVETAMNDPARAKPDEARADAKKLRQSVLLLAGAGELPANNTANLGYLLYSEHLLAIEMAGTLLLVAAIGAIAIAHRKGAAA